MARRRITKAKEGIRRRPQPKPKPPAVAVGGGGDGSAGPPRMSGPGLRVRLSGIPEVTHPKRLHAPLYLQNPPLDEWAIEGEGSHNDVDTATSGEFSHAGSGVKLQTTTIDSLVVSWDAPWLTAFVSADHVISELTAIRDSRTPFLVLATWPGGTVELNMYCTLRRLRHSVKAGEPDTRYFSIDLKQWRDPNPERKGEGASKTSAKLPTTHKLKAGDTLNSLSKRYYGSYSHWRSIAGANGIKNWGASTALVKRKGFKPGHAIKIPKI